MAVLPSLCPLHRQLREYGYSRDAAILRFLLDGRPDALANLLTDGAASFMYNITETSLPELTCRGAYSSFTSGGGGGGGWGGGAAWRGAGV